MEREAVKQACIRFAKRVIKGARQNLTRKGINASKNLYDSLEYEFSFNKNDFELDFNAEDYIDFVDKGVSGTQKKYNTPNKYRTKKPPLSAMIRYAKTKPIKPRDKKTGRFITDRQFGFALQNYIYKQGIKPSHFFSRPLELAIPDFLKDIGDAYGDDLDNFIKDNL